MAAETNTAQKAACIVQSLVAGEAMLRVVTDLSNSSEDGLESASCAGVDGGRSFGLAWLCDRSPAQSRLA